MTSHFFEAENILFSVYVRVVRLIEAIDDMKRVIMDSAQFLLTPDKTRYSFSEAESIFDVVCVSNHHQSVSQPDVIISAK